MIAFFFQLYPAVVSNFQYGNFGNHATTLTLFSNFFIH